MNDIIQNPQRITFLDGLRGIAILLVMFFHTYSRYPDVVPYLTDNYGEFPIFKYGYWGVQLFFLISGFVILMTLDKSKSFLQFIGKRWLRLFPAMLVATILIYMTAGILSERPLGIPRLIDILPGLTFMEPSWLSSIFKTTINPLETVFWSLYVEIKFYFIIGILYFTLGKKRAIIGIVVLFVLTMILYFLASVSGVFEFLAALTVQLGFGQLQYFIMGAWAYLYYTEKKAKYLVFNAIFLVIVAIAIIMTTNNIAEIAWLIIVMSLFLLPICFEKIRFLFSNKFLLLIGFVSYPLYLIHSNAIIALTVKLNSHFSVIPKILLPIIPMGIMILIAYIIAKFIEPNLRRIIKRILKIFKNMKMEKVEQQRYSHKRL